MISIQGGGEGGHYLFTCNIAHCTLIVYKA